MIKKISIPDALTYILLVLVTVLLIIYLKSKTNKVLEQFSNKRNLTITSNFYDTTPKNVSIFSQRNINKHIRPNGDEVCGNYIEPDKLNYSLGGKNLCIYKTDRNNNKVTDIECISYGTLQTAIDMPKYRRRNVCIDEECMSLYDAYLLNGEHDFKLALSSKRPTQKNKNSLTCLGKGSIPANSCKPAKINGGIPSLIDKSCTEDRNTRLRLGISNLSREYVDTYGDVKSDDTMSELGLTPGSKIVADHE